MNRSRNSSVRARRPQGRAGFTLVEMLMAVTLVLIMMTMFAEVFQLAGGSVTKQRTLADNDQNSRTFVTVLRRDLDQRTFRSLVPFYANEPVLSTLPEVDLRRGYFSVSNNILGDYTDDVLSFTADSTINVTKLGESKFYGAAVQLPAPGLAAWTGNLAQQRFHFLRNPNQPDADDGEILPNGAASSKVAEISYFMRGTRLYRRVMLVRNPIKQANVDQTNPSQPKTLASADFFLPGNGLYGATRNFWTDFDFSAYRPSTVFAGEDLNFNGQLDGGEDTNGNGQLDSPIPMCARFTGVNFLHNELPPAYPLLAPYCYSLGQTWNRFGHHSMFTPGNTFNGLPREFSGITAPNFFIGRFTQEETSNGAFLYPQVMPAAGDPMNAAATPFADANSDGVIDGYAGGSRAGVDLLLSNVHEFRIELWDEWLQDFVPAGHGLSSGGIAGDYAAPRQLNPSYGPLVAASTVLPNVYDTWHPLYNRNVDAVLGNAPDRPPFRPLTVDPTGISGPTYTNPSGAPIFWTPATAYYPGDVVFPLREDINGNGVLDAGEDGSNGFPVDGFLQENVQVFKEDANNNGVLDMGEDLNGNLILDAASPVGEIREDINGNGLLDMGEDGLYGLPVNGALDTFQLRRPYFPTGMNFRYVCVRQGTTSRFAPVPSIEDEPGNGTWSTTPEYIIKGQSEDQDNDNAVDPGEDSNSNGSVTGVTDREPDWLVVYNVRPLRAIRITVRFEHPTTQQMKQVTIVHSLRDTQTVP